VFLFYTSNVLWLRLLCFIINSFTYNDGFHFLWKNVWWTKVPLMVAFFVWSAVLGKIFSIYNLRKRHAILVDRCCMCKRNGEFIDHIILHCVVACVI
jgi:hypothetical protein